MSQSTSRAAPFGFPAGKRCVGARETVNGSDLSRPRDPMP
jgi:hypothetical protein